MKLQKLNTWLCSCLEALGNSGSYPAGDFGGAALDPTDPWPDLDCMLMASIFAMGAGPRPVTHRDRPRSHFANQHFILNTSLIKLTHLKI